MFRLEIIVRIAEKGFRRGDEFGIGIAQAQDGAFVGWGGLRVHVGVVGKRGVGMIVVDGDAIDLWKETVVDFLDVGWGGEGFGLRIGGGD